jgi:hypothetical protein
MTSTSSMIRESEQRTRTGPVPSTPYRPVGFPGAGARHLDPGGRPPASDRDRHPARSDRPAPPVGRQGSKKEPQ